MHGPPLLHQTAVLFVQPFILQHIDFPFEVAQFLQELGQQVPCFAQSAEGLQSPVKDDSHVTPKFPITTVQDVSFTGTTLTPGIFPSRSKRSFSSDA
jgi:hypothetical protein